VRTLLLVLASALLRGLAQPGWLGWPWLLLAAPLRILSWNRPPARRAWAFDLAHGFIFWCLAFSFLGAIHPVVVPGAALLMSPLAWIEGALARRLQRWMPLPAAGALALAATGWLQAEWFLIGAGGVPWASWAWPLADSPLLPLASSLGESGLVALVAALGGGIAALALRQPRDPVLLAAPLLLGAGLLTITPLPLPTGTLRCLAVQGCIRVEDKVRADRIAPAMYRKQKEMTHAAFEAGERPRLVLWAETMWPFPVVESDQSEGLYRNWSPDSGYDTAPISELSKYQRMLTADLLAPAPPDCLFATGVHLFRALPESAAETALSPRSSETVIFGQGGELLGHLAKSELVPFGERLPLWGKFPFARKAADLIQVGSGLRPDFLQPGDVGPLRVAGLPALGFATCWENVFTRVFRRQADRGAEAFVVLSNEDWYADHSREMAQMLAATRLRAVETRRPILRVTNTGTTALIGAEGAVTLGPEVGTPATWGVDLPLMPPETRTAYLQWGRWLLPVLAALAAVLAVAPRRRQGRVPIDRPGRAG
jgi:apolipoprotein N-acyltransferase